MSQFGGGVRASVTITLFLASHIKLRSRSRLFKRPKPLLIVFVLCQMSDRYLGCYLGWQLGTYTVTLLMSVSMTVGGLSNSFKNISKLGLLSIEIPIPYFSYFFLFCLFWYLVKRINVNFISTGSLLVRIKLYHTFCVEAWQ